MSKVRNMLLKMEGLQTRQYLASSSAAAPAGQSGTFVVPLGDNATLASMSPVPQNSDQKAFLRQMEVKTTMSNGTNCQLIVRMYKLRCRKNCNVSINGLLIDGAPAYNFPYSDPTTSNGLRRYFHIVKRYRRKLDVGDSMQFTMRRFWRGGRQVTGDVEITNNFFYTPLTMLMFVCVDTVPLEDTAAALAVGTGAVKANYVNATKYTYYVDTGDNDPVSTLTDGISAVTTTNLFTDVSKQQEAVDT